MGEVLDYRTGEPRRGAAAGPTIDPLTVEVATAIWRLGGEADGDAIARAVAQGRGRSDGMNPSERSALAQAISEQVDARAALRREALLRRMDDEGHVGWALTPLARAVLGLRP